MKKALTHLTVINLLFLSILMASGFFASPLKEIVYYLAFIIPLALSAIINLNQKERRLLPLGLKLGRDGAITTLTLLAPTLGIVFVLSYLTSLLVSLFGEPNITDVSGNLFVVILLHAVLPSLLEEAIFRYLPLTMLSQYSKKAAVLYSAAFFSLVHCNLFQMPYAFAAGIIFAVVDISLDSIWPSVIFHFVNNLASIIWLRYAEIEGFYLVYIIVLATLSLLSLIPVFIYRKKYSKMLTDVFNDKCKEKLSLSPIAFALCCILIAVMSL